MLVRKLAAGVKFATGEVNKRRNINTLVMGSHIFLVFTYTIISIFYFVVPATNGSGGSVAFYRCSYAWTLVGGAADLFITCIIWFILDNNAPNDIFRHGTWTYAMLEVIKPVSQDMEEQEEENKEPEQEQEPEQEYEI